MKKVLVGLSGGVDSAISAYILKKQGYNVTAGFMINYLAPEGEYCQTKEDLIIAKEVANFLEIPFFTFDYRDTYHEKVLKYMYEGYQKGITPNPDIMCNSEVKFKVFLEEAIELGFDYVSTGHYAIIEEDKAGIFHLKKGIDKNKDQSYFLAGLNQLQLSKTIFPIGSLKKDDVRKMALEINLPNALRKDSQGICFVGKVDMIKFLEKKISPKPGLVKNTSGKILGNHKGVFYYTIGQRKGLEIGGQEEPIFVIKKDIEKNEIIVGNASDLELYDNKLFVENFHFLGNIDYVFPLNAKAKIRYRQIDQNCIIYKEETRYRVEFENKQRAIAKGQICAIYLNDELIISGVIS